MPRHPDILERLSATIGVPVVGEARARKWHVYRFFKAGSVDPYYVGQTNDLHRRLGEHKRAGLAVNANRVRVDYVESARAALALEAHFISLWRPATNAVRPVLLPIERWWYDRLRELPRASIAWWPGTGDLAVWFRDAVYLHAFPVSGTTLHWYPDADPDAVWRIAGRSVVIGLCQLTGIAVVPRWWGMAPGGRTVLEDESAPIVLDELPYPYVTVADTDEQETEDVDPDKESYCPDFFDERGDYIPDWVRDRK